MRSTAGYPIQLIGNGRVAVSRHGKPSWNANPVLMALDAGGIFATLWLSWVKTADTCP
jgi:hypothetical protein